MLGEISLFKKSIGDFLTPVMLRLALLPFVIVGIVTLGGFFMLAGAGLDALGDGSLHIQSSEVHIDAQGAMHKEEHNATFSGSSLVSYLLSNPYTSGIFSFLIYTVGSLAAALFSIYLALVVIGFLTPVIVRHLAKRHYPGLQLSGYGSPLGSLWFLVKNTLAAFLMLFVLIPLFFIPGVNLVAFNLPFYYLFHKQLTRDVASEMMDKREAIVIRAEEKNRLRFRTLLLYILSLIPFMWLLLPVFYVIYLANGYLQSLDALRRGGEV